MRLLRGFFGTIRYETLWNTNKTFFKKHIDTLWMTEKTLRVYEYSHLELCQMKFVWFSLNRKMETTNREGEIPTVSIYIIIHISSCMH